VVVTCP